MDLISFSNPILGQKKLDLLEKMQTDLFFNYRLTLEYHGVLVNINASRESILKLVLHLVPPSWIMDKSNDMNLNLIYQVLIGKMRKVQNVELLR